MFTQREQLGLVSSHLIFRILLSILVQNKMDDGPNIPEEEGSTHLQVRQPVLTLILPPVLNSMFTASDNVECFTAQ